MSVASEITRIQGAKADLKTAINAKTDSQHQITTETIDNYATFVNSISGGSQKPEQSKTTNPSTSQVVVTPDTGYTLSSVTVNAMPSGALRTPTINSSTGVVTASVGTSGYLANGTSKTLQLNIQGAQTITPTTSNQTITSGKFLVGNQTIKGDANLVAGNIKKDVTIFGVTGTHEGGSSATLITKSITENGTYNASSDNADGYSQVTVNVSGGGTVEPEEKDVNYYDYDGTRLYSYTKEEFLALETEPELPTKNGITYTSWNVDFTSAAKPLVGRGDKLDIGALGKPSDCDIKIFINLPEEFKSPYIYVGTNSSCTIDWGDGSSPQSYNPSTSDYNGWINPTHTFPNSGKYEIKITSNSNSASFYLKASGQANSHNDSQKTGGLLWGGTSSDNSKTNMIYASCIEEIWLGEKVSGSNVTHHFSGFTNLKAILTNGKNNNLSDQYSFFNCRSLKTFNVPKNNIHNFKDYTFKNCHSLKRITGTKWRFVYGSSGTSTKTFENCFSLEKMPTSAPTFPVLTSGGNLSGCSYLFEKCYLLSHIYIGYCEKIGTSTFDGNYPTVKVFDFSNVTSIPTLSGTGAFSSGTSDYEIWVPSSLYNDWITASNWSSISSHIISK